MPKEVVSGIIFKKKTCKIFVVQTKILTLQGYRDKLIVDDRYF